MSGSSETRRVHFQGSVEVPVWMPDADVEEWLQFEIGECCRLPASNAMAKHDIKSCNPKVELE